MASRTWSLLSCLLLSVVQVSQAHRLKLKVVRTVGNYYCANVQCTFDANDESSDKFNTRRITIFDVTQQNVRGNVASLSQNENLYIDPARANEINGTGTISQYDAALSISISDQNDCAGELFQCEVEFINGEEKTEVIQKSITTASGTSSDADTNDEQDNDCQCSLIKYRFQRLADMKDEAKRSLAYASDKDKEIAGEIALLRNYSKTSTSEITRLQFTTQVNTEEINALVKSDNDIQQRTDELRSNIAEANNNIESLKRVDQSTKEDINLLKSKDIELNKQMGDLTRIDKLQGEALNNISHSQSITSEEISQLSSQDEVFDNELQGLRATNKEFKTNIATLANKDRDFEKQINDLRKNDKSIIQGINGLRKNQTVTSRSLINLAKKDKRINDDLAKLTFSNTMVEDDLTKLRQADDEMSQEMSELAQTDTAVTEEISALKSRDADIKVDIQKLVETDTSLQNQIDKLQDKGTSTDTEVSSMKTASNAQYEALTALKVSDKVLDEKISRHVVDISALQGQINEVWDQYKSIDEKLVGLSVRVASLESLIDSSSQITTVTRTTTNLVLKSCTPGMTHSSPRVQFLLNGVTPALCDTETVGGGWIVIQRRTTGSVDFYRSWSEYKNGFGLPSSDFYLGNEIISNLTAHGYTHMRVDLTFKGRDYFAYYKSFQVGDDSTNYKLSVSGYQGTAGDSMTYHDGAQFTTLDRDNDKSDSNCAVTSGGAWWYNSCYHSNPNGRWATNGAEGVIWKGLSETESVSYIEIKVRLAQ